jgi:hypothetical protein
MVKIQGVINMKLLTKIGNFIVAELSRQGELIQKIGFHD